VNFAKVCAKLNNLKHKCDGLLTVIGSPQGVGSVVSDEKPAKIVAKHPL
jgi:hypothetical protein